MQVSQEACKTIAPNVQSCKLKVFYVEEKQESMQVHPVVLRPGPKSLVQFFPTCFGTSRSSLSQAPPPTSCGVCSHPLFHLLRAWAYHTGKTLDQHPSLEFQKAR